MATPLSDRSADSLNRISTPASNTMKTATIPLPSSPDPVIDTDKRNSATAISEGPPSSPFQTEVEQHHTATSIRPEMSQLQTPRAESPTKTFSILEDDAGLTDQSLPSSPSPQKVQSGASRREAFAVKTAVGDETLSRIREQIYIQHVQPRPDPRSPSDKLVRKEEDDYEHDERSMMSDDTCFSAFSAVPNADMTLFARLGDRTVDNTLRNAIRQTPQAQAFHTPSTSRRDLGLGSSRSSSPTPRGQQQQGRRDGDTTNLLLDFTQQFEPSNRSSKRSPSKRTGSPTKSTTEPNLLSYINHQRMPSPTKGPLSTPSSRKNLMTLLDFDLPPQPTPRSLPSITVRELESLKSQYLSEISSLKASLSGREAEVESLKKAVNDAERRVGQAQEELREERSTREHAEREKESWEKKGREVEAVLQSVREEFLFSEKEREDVLQKLDESNQLREEAEMKLTEANTKATIAQTEIGVSNDESRTSSLSESIITQRVNEQLDEKMENLARELHTVYKKKHEAKVSTLKKTYETRAEKRCTELNLKIEELSKQNEELQISKDATFSGTLPGDLSTSDRTEQQQRLESQSTELEEQRAKVAGLAEEIKTLRENHAQVLQELECERVEKGELVAAVDEMLALQSEAGGPAVIEDFCKSISRPPSGLRGPGFTALKASAIPGKSRMMSNIQRMQ